MDYLFFDTECANCLHGEGKICSFGYVRTDENFHVLKKKDILVDPDAPFLLGNAKKGEGIQLGYPLSRFRYAHTFPYYYEEIKRLFQLPDTLYFGFCIHQDIGFLDYTCQRYGLPFFDFEYVDIQKLDKALFQCKDYRGLDTLVELFGLARFTYHRSDDDALMTMEVLQKLLLEQGLALSDAMKRYPFVHGYSIDVARRIREKRRQKEEMRRIKEKAQALFAGKTLPSLSYYTPFFWNKKVAFRSRCTGDGGAGKGIPTGLLDRNGPLLRNRGRTANGSLSRPGHIPCAYRVGQGRGIRRTRDVDERQSGQVCKFAGIADLS